MTVAVWIRGRCATADVPFYLIAQVVAAGAAAAFVNYVRTGKPTVEPATKIPEFAAVFLVELVFTFALAYVVLNVATAKANANNSFYGLAIGFTVLAGAVAVGDISGGVFNPAVGVGVVIMGLAAPAAIWMHILAKAAGGALAGVVFKYLNPADK